MIVWRKKKLLAAFVMGFFFFIGVAAQAEPWQFIRDDNVILDLLRNGEMNLSKDVAKEMSLKEGILQIRRLGLKKDGQQIRAAFRNIVLNMQHEGTRDKYYDAYYNESAAYVISKYLGLNIIPATVLRDLPITQHGLKKSDRLRRGSLQLWVENSAVWHEFLKDKETYPGDPVQRNLQLKEIKAFDCIIGNVDRHAGNLLLDLNERWPSAEPTATKTEPYLGKIWGIDHSRAFPKIRRMNPRYCQLNRLNIKAISLVFMQRLRNWQISEVEAALRVAGHSETQLRNLHLPAVDIRAKRLRDHLEEEQANRQMSDDEFYSAGPWHEVW